MNSIPNPGSVEVAGPPTEGLLPSSSEDGTPKQHNHQSYTLIGVTSMLLVLCLIAVAGRLKSRRMTRASLSLDDHSALTALVCPYEHGPFTLEAERFQVLLIALCFQQFYRMSVCLRAIII